MKTLLAVILLASPAGALSWSSYFHEGVSAKTASACPGRVSTVVVNTHGYTGSLGNGECFVSVSSMESTGLVYRAYSFFDTGMLMVFNSYGDGENNPNLTSAREYYFFPRRGAMELAMDPAAKTVSVRMSDGRRAVFNPATAQIASVERGTVVVSPRIDPVDRGGVEFPSYDGLMLDAGFRMGELPSGRPDADSVFRSAQGQLCSVKNRELFTYTPDGDHRFKFDDAQLSAWLATRCPGLSAGF